MATDMEVDNAAQRFTAETLPVGSTVVIASGPLQQKLVRYVVVEWVADNHVRVQAPNNQELIIVDVNDLIVVPKPVRSKDWFQMSTFHGNNFPPYPK